MWDLHYKESWAQKNWCFWTVVVEKTLESPLDCKEIQPVNPTGNQSWIFIGKTDAEAEAPILWPLEAKNWLTRKDPDAGEDWRGGGEGDDRGWDGWMASLTRCTWVWVNSRSWWWTGRPGVLQSMGWQRVGHDWVTELKWTFPRSMFSFLVKLAVSLWHYHPSTMGFEEVVTIFTRKESIVPEETTLFLKGPSYCVS